MSGFDLWCDAISIFFGSPGRSKPGRSNNEFLLDRIRFTLSEFRNVKTCMLNDSNK